ncbi:MAG: DUF2273 domain-containing protein [Firmicutes bacterium]|nr:DUF2273 domain-containing protein [Bacillota bacterium]
MWEKLLIDIVEKHRGKALGILVGFILGILIISYGFFKALFISLCMAGGYLIGKRIDDKGDLREMMSRVWRDH